MPGRFRGGAHRERNLGRNAPKRKVTDETISMVRDTGFEPVTPTVSR